MVDGWWRGVWCVVWGGMLDLSDGEGFRDGLQAVANLQEVPGRRRGSAYIALLAEIRMCFATMIMYTYGDMSPGQGWK